jgi:hypothetical protein
MKKLSLFVMIIALSACATTGSSSKFAYTQEVRSQSFTSNVLFHDLLTAIGGVGRLDESTYPQTKERTIIRIQVILPYDLQKTGIERWTIRHDGDKVAVYQVALIPDGEGSTDFSVTKVQ